MHQVSALPGVNPYGCKVQLVLGLEDQCLDPDVHDGGRLQWGGNGKQS